MKIQIPVPNPTQFIKDVGQEVWPSRSMPFLEEQDYQPVWALPKNNRAWVAEYLPKATIVGDWKGDKLWHVPAKLGNQAFYFLLNEASTKAVYVVRYATLNILGIEACCQTSIWRDTDAFHSVSVATWVFFHKLLPKFGAVLSDSSQSKDGKAFWLRRCFEAGELGYRVYAVRLDKNVCTTVEPANLRSLNWTKRLWSTLDKGYQHRRLLITKTPLASRQD